jgi:hypothetical protein
MIIPKYTSCRGVTFGIFRVVHILNGKRSKWIVVVLLFVDEILPLSCLFSCLLDDCTGKATIYKTIISSQSRILNGRFQNSLHYSPFDTLISRPLTASISAFLLLSSVTVALMSSISIRATSSFLRRPDTILS